VPPATPMAGIPPQKHNPRDLGLAALPHTVTLQALRRPRAILRHSAPSTPSRTARPAHAAHTCASGMYVVAAPMSCSAVSESPVMHRSQVSASAQASAALLLKGSLVASSGLSHTSPGPSPPAAVLHPSSSGGGRGCHRVALGWLVGNESEHEVRRQRQSACEIVKRGSPKADREGGVAIAWCWPELVVPSLLRLHAASPATLVPSALPRKHNHANHAGSTLPHSSKERAVRPTSNIFQQSARQRPGGGGGGGGAPHPG
jgi:hypothetical protein